MSNSAEILDLFYKNKEQFNPNFRLKIWRSLSWLKNAEQSEQLDLKFISQWIAFNAAYADELSNILGDKNTFIDFLKRICDYDTEKTLQKIINKHYQNEIKNLLEQPYTFQPFWDYHNGKKSEEDWQFSFRRMKKRINTAFTQQKTHIVLHVIFNHLYTLRNQLIHGGSTFESSANRKQLTESCVILGALVPAILVIMMNCHSEVDWGKPFYPYIQDNK